MIEKTGSQPSNQPGGGGEQTQVDAVKKRIRKILAELKALAKTEIAEEEFLSQLLGRTLETTGAAGATIWQVDDDGVVSVVHERGTTSNQVDLDAAQLSMHERLVRTVVANMTPTLIEPDARDKSTNDVLNPMAFLLLLKPLHDAGLHRNFVIELFQRPDIAPAARTGYMRYLEEIGDIFAAWQTRDQLRFQSTRSSQQQRTMNFVRDIHGSLDPRDVAYAAANDGSVMAGCDRLSVLEFDGRRCKVLSVSGQDDFDDRSNIIRKQQDLATQVCRSQQPLWLIGQRQEGLPRATQDLVDDYLNDSHARTLGIIPLFDGKEPVDLDTETEERDPTVAKGALILEWFGQDVVEEEVADKVEILSDHVGRALSNAQEYKGIFLLPLWRALGKWKWLVSARTLPKTIAIAASLLLLTLFFCFFPYPFDMRVDGVLQPIKQQNIYPNIDGVISIVHVHHGKEVKKDDLLLTLRNDDLDFQLTSLQGQLQELNKRIETANASALISPGNMPQGQADNASSLVVTLKEQKVTINDQIAKILQKQRKLEIRSPIAGTVVSWDPVRQLTERPVSNEDLVLVIAAVDSDWQMELFIPERKYGHVVTAAKRLKEGESMEVTFFAATDPNKTYKGTITQIEQHASEHPTHGNTVRAFARFDPKNRPELYVGAAVTAKVHCGKTSIGNAWFHELFEFVQAKLLF